MDTCLELYLEVNPRTFLLCGFGHRPLKLSTASTLKVRIFSSPQFLNRGRVAWVRNVDFVVVENFGLDNLNRVLSLKQSQKCELQIVRCRSLPLG